MKFRWKWFLAFAVLVALGVILARQSHGAHDWRPFIDPLGRGLDGWDFASIFVFALAYFCFRYGFRSRE